MVQRVKLKFGGVINMDFIRIIFFILVFVSFFSEADEASITDQVKTLSNDKLNINGDFGDHFDVSSGTMSFSRKDGDIPGNFPIEVSYRLKYNTNFPIVHGWLEDVPRIWLSYARTSSLYTSYASINENHSNLPLSWKVGQYCSGNEQSADLTSNTSIQGLNRGWAFSQKKISVPGKVSDDELLTPDINNSLYSSAKYITKSNWKVECFSSTNGVNGFKAISPDGLIYYFDQIGSFPSTIKGGNDLPFLSYFLGQTTTSQYFFREPVNPFDMKYAEYSLFVSKIEDKFGNWVKYEYDHTQPSDIDRDTYNNLSLRKITSSDGRELSVSRIGNDTILNSAGRIWKYKNTILNPNDRELGKNTNLVVIQPDGKTWTYDLHSTDVEHVGDSSGRYTCSRAFNPDESRLIPMVIKSPYGLKMELTYKYIRSDESNIYTSKKGIKLDERRCHYTYALVKKTITSDNNSDVWSYYYSNTLGAFDIEDNYGPKESYLTGSVPSGVNRQHTKTVTVNNPDNTSLKYFINRKSRTYLFGSVSAIEMYDKNTTEPNRTIFYTYGSSSFKGIQKDFSRNEDLLKYYPLVKSETVIENQSSYVKNYIYNQFDAVINKKEYDPSNFEKVKITDYFHDLKNWHLNQISNIKIADFNTSKSIASYIFKEVGPKSIPLVSDELNYGKLVKSYTYHADGNVLLTAFADSNKYTRQESYYRGKARKFTLPCATTNSCNTANGSTTNTIVALLEVNADGTTSSVTDFNGNKTSYSYNPVGWLTKIDYADPKWTDKVVSYAMVTSAGDGISGSNVAVGSLRQTISHGNYEKRIYHDGLLRPIFIREGDTANASTIRYQTMAYDHDNRQTLSSFPSSDAGNRLGMETEYDALGRIISQTRTSDGSVSRREYLSGNKVAVTDGENNTTTTTYLAYGEPAYDKPTLIEAPDTDDIAIDYNVFEQITRIRQGNIVESRIYDAYQQLCKQIRPETGMTAFGYNGQRQQIWRAEGTIGSTLDCDAAAVPATHKTLLAYDNLVQLRTENFPDSTPDKTYSYDGNGNITSLLAGSVNWTYLYNSSNTIEKETLALDGKNFVLDWEYNNLGALSSLKYPSGAIVDFAPNALGQATKAGSYASGVSYHPNGQIKQFTYGNGIIRNVALDTTGRIDALTDIKAGSVKNSLDPSYDNNDNLARLIDWVDRNNDVDNLAYDGVDRLKSADGKWGSGRYNYDGLGNVLSRSLNNSTITYNYNSLNRLNNLMGAYAYGYQYDTRGNVTNNGRYSLTYNLGQQMTSAKGISYVYDGHNRRVKQNKADGSHYSVYSQAGQLLYREAANGTKSDNVFLGKQLIAEVDNAESYYIKFEKTNPPEVCRQEPIPGSKKTKTICTQDKKGFSWTTQNASSCTGEVQRLIGTNISGTTKISGTSGSLNLGRHFTLNITMTCLTNSNQTITAAYSL
ncbi:RHS repeat domain-containing protein [Shewanella sp. CG12_big_fil_rev_8_21_14_0_65_47_15]|uniref:RHS repeat domain-containing protein n=1 Tax=Shewanella sp. CG12_big_fil_rev_8_21_14_0_65_47_15 TaxID=1975537 RepID=UPI0025E04CB5|nr:RHS repeat domain-containing protein [Shewanella sp. CG12_big_fil_rev_8_21_14_0_65_47_15]